MKDVIDERVKVEEKENRIYKIYEMKDELDKSLENLNKIIHEHEILVDVLAKAKRNELQTLAEQLPKNIDEYKAQLEKLNNKRNTCIKLINLYENKVLVATNELIEIIFDLIF